MGYQTKYVLECSDNNILKKVYEDSKNEESDLCYAVDENGEANDTIKWYTHVEDMKKISKKYQGVIFILFGEGEGSGDIWRKYFLNGKVQETFGVITFDPFDTSKLK